MTILMSGTHNTSTAAFFNKANAVIDMTLDSVDDIFETIRKGTLPSVSFSRPAGDHAPMSKYWVDLVAQVTKLDMSVIDDVLSTKRSAYSDHSQRCRYSRCSS